MRNKITFLSVMLLATISSCQTYCDNGQPKNGIQIENYANGNIESKTEVKNCLCHGTRENYYLSKILKSKGTCIDGNKEGQWVFYSQDGKLISESEWQNGILKKLKVYFSEHKHIELDSLSAILSEKMKRNNIANPLDKLRMIDPDIQILNDSLAGISDYGKLIVISDMGAILFDINTVKDSLFNDIISRKAINYETPESQFLKDGIKYYVEGNELAISIHYYDSLSNKKPLQKLFKFSLIK